MLVADGAFGRIEWGTNRTEKWSFSLNCYSATQTKQRRDTQTMNGFIILIKPPQIRNTPRGSNCVNLCNKLYYIDL